MFFIIMIFIASFFVAKADANPTLTLCQEFPEGLPDGDYIYKTTYIKKGKAWLLDEMSLTAKKPETFGGIKSYISPNGITPL